MIAIGIDPGFSGGIAAIGPTGAVLIYDLPTMLVEGSTKDHTEYDLRLLASILRGWVGQDARIAIEFVRGIPRRPGFAGQQGASSIWLQGHGVGVLEGIIAGLGLSYERVSPQRWRKALGLEGGLEAKESSRLRAIQMFPDVADKLKLKKHHGRAESLLIAEWLRRTSGAAA